jgi:hypothetical protein
VSKYILDNQGVNSRRMGSKGELFEYGIESSDFLKSDTFYLVIYLTLFRCVPWTYLGSLNDNRNI